MITNIQNFNDSGQGNQNINSEKTMSSREIAEMTGKMHKNIMQSIRNMEDAWAKVNGLKFQLVEYIDAKGEKRAEYQLSKKECLYIATKFNDEARAILINRWEELEKINAFPVPGNMYEALLLAAQQYKVIDEQQKQLNKQAPQIEFLNRVLDTDEKVDIGQCAKILELPFGRNTLFKKLRDNGVFFKQKNEPKQLYIDRGYFQLKEKWIERENHESFMIIKVLVTQRGLGFLSTMFKSDPKPKKDVKLV
ncbi:Rha family transcriptional regulator [Sphingobacterium multivorum]|uniref:Rha family transcriptional regulator n=1 Tax=Sphingobacterium multivorum TaxID=28454 RepID=UPI0028AC401B|nr:phage regulatory protein/antirepressor Ant [Sphingobacterium multivorum]